MLRIGHLAGALALTAIASCALAQQATTVALVPGESAASQVGYQTVALQNDVHPLALPEFDAGVVSADTKLDHMVLVLSPTQAQQSALDALVAAQQDPHSPLYHHWISPAEYGARFGVTEAQRSQVTAWLTRQGFTVDELPAGNRLIVFSGTAGQVSDSFHTEMRRYVIDGVTHIANAQNALIPAELGSVASGIVSLHDFPRNSEIARHRLPSENVSDKRSGAQPDYTAGSEHYVFPADFATIYDLNPLYSAGTTGAGISIAIAGRSNINLSDVARFRSTAGLPAKAPSVVLPGTDPGLAGEDQLESSLDVEWSGAVAPNASVTLVAEPSTSATDGIDLAAEYIVNHALAQVVSVSYGTCESAMGSSERGFYSALWEQAAAQGMSVFVSSGDAGAAGCASPSANAASTRAVNGLCSSPYSTCVGGTEFNDLVSSSGIWATNNSAGDGSALGYIPEIVWNESALDGGSGLWASGGGPSGFYAQPSWQAEASGAAAANGMRGVPDVAISSADHDGAMMVENGSFWVVSGTSVAAPSFAGIMALVTEKTGTAQGSANPTLYQLAGADPAAFHGTPSGNNSVPGVEGFTASGATYNLATGLGSVDGAVLADDWAALSEPPSLTLTVATSSITLAEPNSAAVGLSVATGGSFAGNVAFSISGLPAGVTAAWSANPLPASSNATETLTLTGSASATLGSSRITVTASGDGVSSTQSIALTVQAACLRAGLVRMRCGAPVIPVPRIIAIQ